MCGSYPCLYRAWGRPGAPAGPRRPRLCIEHLHHTPLFPVGLSSPSRLLQLRDQGGCRQTSSQRAGTKAHHRGKVQSVPAPHSGNAPSSYCDLSTTKTVWMLFTGWHTFFKSPIGGSVMIGEFRSFTKRIRSTYLKPASKFDWMSHLAFLIVCSHFLLMKATAEARSVLKKGSITSNKGHAVAWPWRMISSLQK